MFLFSVDPEEEFGTFSWYHNFVRLIFYFLQFWKSNKSSLDLGSLYMDNSISSADYFLGCAHRAINFLLLK